MSTVSQEAHEAFTEWFNHSGGAPQKPAPVPEAKFTERVANEMREEEYQVKRKQKKWSITLPRRVVKVCVSVCVLQTSLAAWSSRLEVLTKDVKERIYNVLLFVDGGWMIDTKQVPATGSSTRRGREKEVQLKKFSHYVSQAESLF